MLRLLLGFLALLVSGENAQRLAVAGQGAGAQWGAARTADENETPAGATDAAPAVRSSKRIILRQSPPAEEPRVWLGLRVTELPAPLAAHIGPAGVMIANVARRSPADQAELQQYDVILKVDQQTVAKPDDLLATLRRAQPGQRLRLTILRKGAEREVEITAAERPRDGDWEMKYEEPEDALINDALFLRGRTLRLGPDGRWMIEELGPLSGLDDLLKRLRRFGVPDFGEPDADDWLIFRDAPGDDMERDAHVEIQIQVEQDGQRVSIRRLPDGKIEVTRRAPDGHESTATYENAEVLREAEPRLYRLYRRHAPEIAPNAPWGRWRAPTADRWARQMQAEIQRKLRDALDRARDALEEAERRSDNATRKYEVTRELKRPPAAGGKETETLLVEVRDDGSIAVEYSRNGRNEKYEFKTRAEFEAAQPELYARVKTFLE